MDKILKPKSLKESLENAKNIWSNFPQWKKEAFKIETQEKQKPNENTMKKCKHCKRNLDGNHISYKGHCGTHSGAFKGLLMCNKKLEKQNEKLLNENLDLKYSLNTCMNILRNIIKNLMRGKK